MARIKEGGGIGGFVWALLWQELACIVLRGAPGPVCQDECATDKGSCRSSLEGLVNSIQNRA